MRYDYSSIACCVMDSLTSTSFNGVYIINSFDNIDTFLLDLIYRILKPSQEVDSIEQLQYVCGWIGYPLLLVCPVVFYGSRPLFSFHSAANSAPVFIPMVVLTATTALPLPPCNIQGDHVQLIN